MSLRIATPADAEALTQLGRDTFCETFAHLYKPEDLNAYLAKAYDTAREREALADAHLHNIVAQVGGALAGYAKAGVCKLPIDVGNERAYELCRLYVRRAHQQKGIGRMLMECVLEEARARGFDALYLGVWEKNHSAQTFYARYGFSEAGEYTFYVGAQADRELILRKTL